MQLKPIGHNCPVCSTAVMGYRATKRYCSDTCKAIHHKNSKIQLKSRLNACKKARYIKLLRRNLYLAEALIGPENSKLFVKMGEMKCLKFQFGEGLDRKMQDSNFFKISNFEFRLQKGILEIKRTTPSPSYEISVAERWLIDFPEKSEYEGFGELSDQILKKKILKLGGVWRE